MGQLAYKPRNYSFLTNMPLDPEQTEAQIRDWFFASLPAEAAAFNQPHMHFGYFFEVHDRAVYEPLIALALGDLAQATTDQNFINIIRIFEYALNNGLGAIAYEKAHIVTYRLGIISVQKDDPEINLRIIDFLNNLDAHASDQ